MWCAQLLVNCHISIKTPILYCIADDATLLRTSMGEQLLQTGWKVFEDNQIERGGCRVETAHSQIDATLPKRWQRIVASIGQDNAWLES